MLCNAMQCNVLEFAFANYRNLFLDIFFSIIYGEVK